MQILEKIELSRGLAKAVRFIIEQKYQVVGAAAMEKHFLSRAGRDLLLFFNSMK